MRFKLYRNTLNNLVVLIYVTLNKILFLKSKTFFHTFEILKNCNAQ